MSKEYTYIKATGVRKELQAINQTLKSLVKILDKQSINHEKCCNCNCSSDNDDTYGKYEETGRSFGI